MALLHCELRFGSAFAYAPARWGTTDGGPPVRIVWAYFAAVAMGRAMDAMDTARGIGLAFTDPAGAIVSPLDAAQNEAFPALPEPPGAD